MKDKAEDSDVYIINNVGDIDPAKLRLTVFGVALYRVLSLEDIDNKSILYVTVVNDMLRLSRCKFGDSKFDTGTF